MYILTFFRILWAKDTNPIERLRRGLDPKTGEKEPVDARTLAQEMADVEKRKRDQMEKMKRDRFHELQKQKEALMKRDKIYIVSLLLP